MAAQVVVGKLARALAGPVTDGMDASPLHRTGSGEFQKGVLA
ncbi:hypothetical protein [Acidithiobacillus sp.]